LEEGQGEGVSHDLKEGFPTETRAEEPEKPQRSLTRSSRQAEFLSESSSVNLGSRPYPRVSKFAFEIASNVAISFVL
jgi:hypothetical protein